MIVRKKYVFVGDNFTYTYKYLVYNRAYTSAILYGFRTGISIYNATILNNCVLNVFISPAIQIYIRVVEFC